MCRGRAAREGTRRAERRAVHVVATVQEEIGLRGATTSAYGIDPHVGIAVDVTHATDCPTIEKIQEGDIKLGGGPVVYRGANMNPVVVEQLRAAADAGEDPDLQMGGHRPRHRTDANAMQLARGGVATGLVSVPNRYMHSAVEMVSLDDLDTLRRLAGRVRLAAFRRTPTLRRGNAQTPTTVRFATLSE